MKSAGALKCRETRRMSISMSRLISAALATAAASALAPGVEAQHVRVLAQGAPTNMLVDWQQISAAPDATDPRTFLAVMPVAAVSTWAVWEPDPLMDMTFGPGNWKRLRMEAPDWAYLTPETCAHRPAAGAAAPQSLLTSDDDYGPYAGVLGVPMSPVASYFVGGAHSVVSGLTNSFSLERWQLRTRGFLPSTQWNACAPSSSVTPNFSGFVGVRFSYSIQ